MRKIIRGSLMVCLTTFALYSFLQPTPTQASSSYAINFPNIKLADTPTPSPTTTAEPTTNPEEEGTVEETASPTPENTATPETTATSASAASPTPTSAFPLPEVNSGFTENSSLRPVGEITTNGDLKQSLSRIGTNILQLLLLLAGILAVMYVVYAGIQYIISGGDAARAKTARATIINVIVGVIIIIASFALVRFAIQLGTSISTLPS